jgi:hypothetical protein
MLTLTVDTFYGAFLGGSVEDPFGPLAIRFTHRSHNLATFASLRHLFGFVPMLQPIQQGFPSKDKQGNGYNWS